MNPLERTLDNDKTHFAVLAIGATAQKMGISTQELYNRLKKVGLVKSLLYDCYDTLHTESIEGGGVECHRSFKELGKEGESRMIRLYHGSFTVVEHPLVGAGRQELDFGPGFYLTSFRDQAERWAKRVSIIKNQSTPYLCSYTLDESLLPNTIRKLLLNKYDIEWLDFIVASRKGQRPWANYDIIEGGVAKRHEILNKKGG